MCGDGGGDGGDAGGFSTGEGESSGWGEGGYEGFGGEAEAAEGAGFSWDGALQGLTIGSVFGVPGMVVGGLLGGLSSGSFSGDVEGADMGDYEGGEGGGWTGEAGTSGLSGPPKPLTEEELIMEEVTPIEEPVTPTPDEIAAEAARKIRDRARRRTGRLSTYVTKGKDLKRSSYYIPTLK